MKKRRNHDAGFKARVALEALKGERTVSELAAEYGVQGIGLEPQSQIGAPAQRIEGEGLDVADRAELHREIARNNGARIIAERERFWGGIVSGLTVIRLYYSFGNHLPCRLRCKTHAANKGVPMSISAATNFTAATNSANSEVQFDQKLTIAKSSQILVDYMNKTGKGTIHGNDLKNLANNTSGNVPQDVMAAASFMTRHQDVFTAIETHDVATVDNFSGVWNLEWAANGGLNGTSLDAITNMTETFDRAIAKSAEITELTTEAKTELDSTKQRPQN